MEQFATEKGPVDLSMSEYLYYYLQIIFAYSPYGIAYVSADIINTTNGTARIRPSRLNWTFIYFLYFF